MFDVFHRSILHLKKEFLKRIFENIEKKKIKERPLIKKKEKINMEKQQIFGREFYFF